MTGGEVRTRGRAGWRPFGPDGVIRSYFDRHRSLTATATTSGGPAGPGFAAKCPRQGDGLATFAAQSRSGIRGRAICGKNWNLRLAGMGLACLIRSPGGSSRFPRGGNGHASKQAGTARTFGTVREDEHHAADTIGYGDNDDSGAGGVGAVWEVGVDGVAGGERDGGGGWAVNKTKFEMKSPQLKSVYSERTYRTVCSA
jgi:hypothetical protein